jgi:hypothetical protein
MYRRKHARGPPLGDQVVHDEAGAADEPPWLHIIHTRRLEVAITMPALRYLV